MLLPKDITDKAEIIIASAQAKGIKISTAESCTGGLISAALTEISGSSAVFDRGFVTYSNEAKRDMLGAQAQFSPHHGAVSAQTASEMAAGAISHSNAQISIAVTGIAGPKSDDSEKPVGLVYIAVQMGRKVDVIKNEFGDIGRVDVRYATVHKALDMLIDAIKRYDV